MNFHCFYCHKQLNVPSGTAYHAVPEEEYHHNDDGYILWRVKQDRGDLE